ncbi:MAG: NeuD/PglB/VioB family sugar acetyltransferase [Gammaproteobacteria bacterium]|nr:NeuD/PglB/VioB family sugar acetyltransferase [Gammaproteobacteria bacterium]
MTEPLFGVYGASGCGRGIMPLAREWVLKHGILLNRLVFIDDGQDVSKVVNGHSVLTYAEFLASDASERRVSIAIANSRIREKIALQLQRDHILAWSVQASNCVIMDDVDVGEGSILSPFVTLTSNIRIGKYFQANLYSYVEHDCIIGDFVTFAPSVKCNGNVHIEDHVYVGTGAMIKQGTPDQPLIIGRGAVIGMGAVVTKSVPAGVTVVGNPARIFVKS